MSFPTIRELCALLPVGVVKHVGGKVRSAWTDVECCDSCHEDHAEGYAGSDYTESWLDDDRYRSATRIGRPLSWSLQFCCCNQRSAFEVAIRAKLDKRGIPIPVSA